MLQAQSIQQVHLYLVSTFLSLVLILVTLCLWLTTQPETLSQIPRIQLKVFIYKIGDGIAALDDYRVQLDDGTATREFYPFIPLRINNKSVFEAGSPATGKEDEIREAWKKGLGGDIDDALTEIEANPSLGDIDYAYLVFGVSLNTQSNVEKQYLFEFFRTLAGRQTTTAADFTNYQATNDTLGNQLRELNVDSPLLNNRAF